MSEEYPEFCPEHGVPGDVLREWACPVATEDDPPGTQTCPHFIREMQRRSRDVSEYGNYFELVDLPDGGRGLQEYTNHQPVGDPERWG